MQYIFSDKTGTLTRNIMQFLKCSIAGVSYGDNVKVRWGVVGKMSLFICFICCSFVLTLCFFVNPLLFFFSFTPTHLQNDENEGFTDPALLDNLTSGHATASVIREWLTLLAVCHTVVPERDRVDRDVIVYQVRVRMRVRVRG